jgi:HK97 family phage major capsid protein
MTYLEELRAAVAAKLVKRDAYIEQMEQVPAGARTEGRSLDDAETAQLAELRASIAELDASLDVDIAKRDELAAEEARTQRLASEARAAGIVTTTGVVSRVQEARTYEAHAPHHFLRDLFARQYQGDQAASARVARHEREMQVESRDRVVSNLGGLLPPVYMTERFAALARSKAPLYNALDAVGQVQPLPAEGVVFIEPVQSTGATAAPTAEGADFTEISEFDVANNTLTATLISAQTDVSRTLFMRANSSLDKLFRDMVAAYWAELDNQLINGSGAAPQHRGIRNVAGINTITYTDASPTGAKFIRKVGGALALINKLNNGGADLAILAPRRWNDLTTSPDANGRPLVVPNSQGIMNAYGSGAPNVYGVPVGETLQLITITDGNIVENIGAGTNEDVAIITTRANLSVWDDGEPMQWTFEQTGAMGKVRLAVGGFSVFSAQSYPKASAVITGTGMITPVF